MRYGFAHTCVVVTSILLVLSSCQPQVYSDLYTYEYLPIPKDSVTVRHAGDSIPDDALAIGKIIVATTAVATKSQYEKVLGLAVREAASNGGNLLVINNQSPTNNKLYEWATIARTESAIPAVTERADKKEKKNNPEPVPVKTAAQMLEIEPKSKEAVRKRQHPAAILKAGIGPMWTTSKIYAVYNRDYKQGIRGTGFGVSITSLPWGSFGFGIDCYGNHASFDNTDRMYGRNDECSFTQLYIGPSLTCSTPIYGPLLFGASFGLGLGVHSSEEQHEAGLGLRSTIGLEWMFTSKIGIGIEGVAQTFRFPKPDGYEPYNNEHYGYQHLGILLGIRIYP